MKSWEQYRDEAQQLQERAAELDAMGKDACAAEFGLVPGKTVVIDNRGRRGVFRRVKHYPASVYVAPIIMAVTFKKDGSLSLGGPADFGWNWKIEGEE